MPLLVRSVGVCFYVDVEYHSRSCDEWGNKRPNGNDNPGHRDAPKPAASPIAAIVFYGGKRAESGGQESVV